MKTFITILVVIILIVGGVYLWRKGDSVPVTPNEQTATTTPQTPEQPATTTSGVLSEGQMVIGKSVEGRDITAYTFGTGENRLLFVGGMHAGYSWNTSLLAYQVVDYLQQNKSAVPANTQVTVIPTLNPDGLYKITGKEGRFAASDIPAGKDTVPGRFNARNVDLNRNFDCEWQATGTWQSRSVSGGSAAFSEPESMAIKNFVETYKPTGAVVWYSAAGGVYASNCRNGVMPATTALTNIYAKASGYPAHQSFDFYEITGDMVNWFTKINIPAISVLLTNHTDTEWTKNKAGVDAAIKYISEN